MIDSYETDLDELSKIPFKKTNKQKDTKKSPLYLKLEDIDRKINNIQKIIEQLEKELKLISVGVKNNALKNQLINRT